MTFDVVVLICRLGMSPWECQPQTAFDKHILANVPNELRCGMDGQQILAASGIVPPDGYWPKITCARHPDERL